MPSCLRPDIGSLVRFAIVLAFALAVGGVHSAPSPQDNQTVSMSDAGFVFQFTPRTLVVPVGTTVTWTNDGQFIHTATSDTGLFDTGDVMPGQSKSFTFNTVGTFPYHCMHHGTAGGVGMAGTITVMPVLPPTSWLPVITRD